MPKVYVYDSWIFNLMRETDDGGYYRVVDNHGRYAAYEKFFSSTSEMEAYVESNGGCGTFYT